MRPWLLVAILAGLPAVAAHGGLGDGAYLPHIELVEIALGPGEQQEWTLAFEGFDMPADWHWLVRADVEGTVRARLDVDGAVSTWNWGTGAHAETMVLGRHSYPRLTLQNTGSDNATVRFYYDQTCDCSVKVAPLSPGILWLNIDAQAGNRVTASLTVQPVQRTIDASAMPRNITVRATHVVPDVLGGYIPHARAESSFKTADPFCDARPVRWNGCMELSFEARASGRQLLHIETWDDAATWHVLVAPLFNISRDQESPLPVGLVLLALALVLSRR